VYDYVVGQQRGRSLAYMLRGRRVLQTDVNNVWTPGCDLCDSSQGDETIPCSKGPVRHTLYCCTALAIDSA
jgi:hypothetical protein